MKVLVTGAGGFVGRSIAQALAAGGHTVIAVDRAFDPDLAARWARQIEMIAADALTLPPVQVDGVVHGAAVTAAPEDNDETPEANFRANLDPLLAALEWSRMYCGGRFMGISSGAVYSRTAAGPLTEDQPPTPEGLYAVAKSTMEALLATLRRQYGRDTLTIRLGSIYGPGERARPTRPRVSRVGQMLEQAQAERRITLTQPNAAREWTYAPDVGRAVEALLRAPALNHALYHVASGQVLTDQEIAQQIQRLLPDTMIEMAVDPAAPLPRTGWLVNERLRQDSGFDRWTSFADGLAQILEAETV